MNVALLRRVRDRILANPKKYDQDESCGTAFCIAGHILLEGGTPVQRKMFRIEAKIAAKKPLSSQQREFWRKNKKDRIRFVLTDAARILGCDDYWDGRQDLFCYGGGWPAPYNVQYLAAKTPEARAKVAARRINKFISSKGTI